MSFSAIILHHLLCVVTILREADIWDFIRVRMGQPWAEFSVQTTLQRQDVSGASGRLSTGTTGEAVKE